MENNIFKNYQIGHVFKNYNEMCRELGFEPAAGGNSRAKQRKMFEQHAVLESGKGRNLILKEKIDGVEGLRHSKNKRIIEKITLEQGEQLRVVNLGFKFNNIIYYISNFGKFYSKENGQLIEFMPTDSGKGYSVVNFRKKTWRIHRLVAIHFIEIPKELKIFPIEQLVVNHKDECKTNNNYTNLEWLTNEMNVVYGTANMRASITRKYGIIEDIDKLLNKEININVLINNTYNIIIEKAGTPDPQELFKQTELLKFYLKYKEMLENIET